MPDTYVCLNAYSPFRVLDPESRQPITLERLSAVFPPSLAAVELSREAALPVPPELAAFMARYRPTPIRRAHALEQALETDCAIFLKDEGGTPTGNHKANSAAFIAHHCRRDGLSTLVTETTGNWGLALAAAARDAGLRAVCFMDDESHRVRPDRKELMEAAGATVHVVARDGAHGDLLSLSADAAIDYTQSMPGATYIFGSVYTYFITPQTIIGAEAREQLGELYYPDIVVGSCGGGANLLGTAGVFLADRAEGRRDVRVVCAESELCPILSQGTLGAFSIDSRGYYPLLETYGLPGLRGDEYIGGLGSTIVASAAAYFHSRGFIETRPYGARDAQRAAALFQAAEGRKIALETAYQLAAAIDLARTERKAKILLNISSPGVPGASA